MTEPTDATGRASWRIERIRERYRQARARRQPWEGLWRDCYELVLPRRNPFRAEGAGADQAADRLFDGTAPDAAEQLAASLLAQLTPPWSRWIGLAPGPDLSEAERDRAAPVLERMAETLHAHLDRSNFAVEIHQCYLDLVIGGTACLMVEEGSPGAASALRFTAVPLSEAVLEEGGQGRLDVTLRRAELTLAQIRGRFPDAALPDTVARQAQADAQARFGLLESVAPDGSTGGYRYTALLDADGAEATLLASGRFADPPFISFRWLKAPGESYGRSPVMKALPDIKTANKVVELVLKNASIAVTGIWQADDDGVLNPATVRLQPGTIIPKAVGSHGLTPLEAPGKFDVSELVLEDLRRRIRHALLADQLAEVETPRMTATEVLERSTQMSRLLGATYGRLQSELLTPLALRMLAILRRRGEVPDLPVDGRLVVWQHRSPLAQAQARRDVQTVLHWIEHAAAMGEPALAAIDLAAATRWLGERYGVPAELIRPPAPAPPARSVAAPGTAPAADGAATLRALAETVGDLAAGATAL